MDRRDFNKLAGFALAGTVSPTGARGNQEGVGATRSESPIQEPAKSMVNFSLQPGSAVLSNGLCRIVWARTEDGWVGQAQIQSGGEWYTLGTDGMPGGGAYEVLEQKDDPVFRYADFADKFRPARVVVQGAATERFIQVHKAFPPREIRPQVVSSSPQRAEVAWKFPIVEEGRKLWMVEANYSLERGAHHIKATVKFTRVESGRPVRVRRVWHVTGIPQDLISSSIRSKTQVAWRLPQGTFMVQATQDRDMPWTPYAGGGGTLNWSRDWFQQYIDCKLHKLPDQAAFHQAPPCLETEGWLDLRKGETYTLKHYIVLHPAYTFSRTLIDYVRRLQPLEYLPPRYPWRYFLDKCLWTLRYTPEAYDDHGEWGLYWKNWFNLTNDPLLKLRQAGSEHGGKAYMIKVHSLDWSSSGAWIAYFLLLYGRKYKDSWALERYQQLRNGMVTNHFQIEDVASPINGAVWMEMDEDGDFHMANFMHPGPAPPYSVWTCDAAKVGYCWALLWEKTGDQVLLEKAKHAASFLLRFQKSDGDMRGSVFAKDGSVATQSNLAGTVSPVLLWSKLYEITKDSKYLIAAKESADFVVKTWMSNNRWQTFGGEIDTYEYPDTTTLMYATMAFSALAMATGEGRHREYTRNAANALIANQFLFDINFGYYRKKARWNGMDERTAGSLQGVNRYECTMSMYMAWKATGDELYRQALEAHANWLTHVQYDNLDSARTFGNGNEGLEMPADHMPGWGEGDLSDTVGQGVAIIEYMNDLDRTVERE
ncbi:MAG: hypothetical protein WB341_13060 [Terracidiphilus sp.]